MTDKDEWIKHGGGEYPPIKDGVFAQINHSKLGKRHTTMASIYNWSYVTEYRIVKEED